MNPGFSRWRALALGCILLVSGCVTLEPAGVEPADLPTLEAAAARQPESGSAQLRLASGLASAGRCGEAMEAARRGMALTPDDPVGPLVLGRCLEDAGDFQGAASIYAEFLDAHGDAAGADVLEGRRVMAVREHARQLARLAIEREEALTPADPESVGVLPFIVDGDPAYQPLSVGLAHMLTTDLALLRRFPLVERVELNALLQELEIPSELVDPATAARAGRLTGAGRMILGTVSIASEQEIRMEGNIVLESGELVEPLLSQGALDDLLTLEKEYALQVAENLGYVLSEAERQRILENRPGNLAAFLAFSRGLLSEDLGDFDAARGFYQAAIQADPQYGDARGRLRGSVGVQALAASGPADAATVAPAGEEAQSGSIVVDLMSSVLGSSILDIASHQSERATIDAGTANTAIDLLPDILEALPALEAIIMITIVIPR